MVSLARMHRSLEANPYGGWLQTIHRMPRRAASMLTPTTTCKRRSERIGESKPSGMGNSGGKRPAIRLLHRYFTTHSWRPAMPTVCPPNVIPFNPNPLGPKTPAPIHPKPIERKAA